MYGHTISIAHNLFQNSSFAGVCSHYGHTYLHLCQFWILGPHPAKSLFGFLHCEIKNQNWRRPIRWPIKTYQSELPVKRKRPKKQNITQTMHINDVFAKNSKMRRKTVLQWNKFVFKWGTRTKFNYWSLNIFLFQIGYTEEIRAIKYHFFVQKSAQNPQYLRKGLHQNKT